MVEVTRTGSSDEEAERVLASIPAEWLDMLMAAAEREFLPAAALAGGRHGQVFSHFARKHPDLFERRFDPSASMYRPSDLGLAVRRLATRRDK